MRAHPWVNVSLASAIERFSSPHIVHNISEVFILRFSSSRLKSSFVVTVKFQATLSGTFRKSIMRAYDLI